MSRVIQGSVKEALNVETSLTVQGSVEAGGTVRGTLVVQGATGGDFAIEAGGSITVQGAASGRFAIAEGGFLLIAGVWAGEVTQHDGRVFMAVGTVVADEAGVLEPDGSLRRHPHGGDVHVNTDASSYLEFGDDGLFYALDRPEK
ncbi:hypothetical protein GCM10010531_39350 [Blastococcus jejuensis]|uniref:Protein CcmA, bactofilin family n=1 Tax=Blastococcus jejuensis TaxID=351224 RepID=A0ABP6PK32_9ACTN